MKALLVKRRYFEKEKPLANSGFSECI